MRGKTRRQPRWWRSFARSISSRSADTERLRDLQAWARAVEKAGTLEVEAVADAAHQQFDTVFGRIGFDEKGDVTGYDTFAWYIWKNGEYAPVDPGKFTE